MKKMCIYIHIPFCKKRCQYCSFFSSTDINYIEPYFDALIKEIKYYSPKYSGYIIESVYIGGGTPSFVSEHNIQNIMDAVYSCYNISNNAEISIEANPETFDNQKLNVYISSNINRYSFGLQSACGNLLNIIGRRHNYGDFVRCVNLLKYKGVKNINCDIMLGLPDQTIYDIKYTIDQILKLDIPHISAYGLSIEKGTMLYDMANNNRVKLPNSDECADMYDIVLKELKNRGIYRYEISNFAKKGYECRHNINYWKRGEYLGFGASAHSFTDNTRYCNVSDIKEYISGNAVRQKNIISEEEGEFEYIMLGLRTADGIKLSDYKKLYGEDFLQKYKSVIEKYNDFFVIKKDRFIVANKGYYVINSLLTQFMR